MRYRPLGKTGWQVSEIGFGAWGLGGDAYGQVRDEDSIQAVRRAVELGVNFFDTADLYGAGHSERVLGQALNGHRGKVLIATKVGTLPHRGFYMPQDFSPRHIREGLEASLRRLRTDYVDLYQLHSPDLERTNLEAAISALEDLRQAGKIRALGLSARTPLQARKALDVPSLATVQVNFNLIDQRAADCGLFDQARHQGVGVIARTPLCFGYLTGQLKGTEQWDAHDHRRNWPAEQLQRWAAAPDAFAAMLREGRTATQLALKFCLVSTAVSTVIPGMMNAKQVEENTAVSGLADLNARELAEIRRIYQAHTFYDSNIKPQAIQTETAAAR